MLLLALASALHCAETESWTAVKTADDVRQRGLEAKYIDASDADESALIEVCRNGSVVKLRAHRVTLSAACVDAICGNPKIRHLDISGSGDPGEKELARLCSKDLNEFIFEGQVNWDYPHIRALKNLPNLRHLDISSSTPLTRTDLGHASASGLTEVAFAELGAAPRLEVLHARNRAFVADEAMPKLALSKSIKEIDFRGCLLLTVSGLASMCQVQTLSVIRAGQAQRIVDDGPPDEARAAAALLLRAAKLRLKELSIPGISGVSDELLRELAAHGTLEVCDVQGSTSVTNLGCHWLSQVATLRHVNLIDCKNVTRDGLLHFSKNSKIEVLAFGGVGCEIRGLLGDVFEVLAKLTTLRSLTVGVRTVDLKWSDIAKLEALQELRVVATSLVAFTKVAEIIGAVVALTSLQQLTLEAVPGVTATQLETLLQKHATIRIVLRQSPDFAPADAWLQKVNSRAVRVTLE